MSNTLRIKRRAAGGASGAPSALLNAELAFNEQDNTLYYGFGVGAGQSAASIVPIGGKGAFADLTTDQTIGGNKTFSNAIIASITGNAATATKFATARNLSLTGDATATLSSFDGSANVSAALTLATVNSNVGTFTKLTVNAKGLVTAAAQASLNDLASPSSAFAMNGQNLTGLADPVNAQDAATKNYVDSVSQGLDAKASVRVATTANISLSGTQTIDGVLLVAGDRVLVKNQTSAALNGIWVVAAGAWSRAADANAWSELVSAFTFVEEGNTNDNTGWVCTVNAGGTLDTTAVSFTQFSAAGSYTAGNGLALSGGQFSVVAATGGGLSVSGTGVAISASYAGQTSITTLGTIGTGVWQGTAIAVGYGGLGLTSAITGLLKGNGTSYSAATAGTDYLDPSSTIDCGTF